MVAQTPFSIRQSATLLYQNYPDSHAGDCCCPSWSQANQNTRLCLFSGVFSLFSVFRMVSQILSKAPTKPHTTHSVPVSQRPAWMGFGALRPGLPWGKLASPTCVYHLIFSLLDNPDSSVWGWLWCERSLVALGDG